MSGLAEIQAAINELSPGDRETLREWFAAGSFPESDELVAAVDEGLRSSQTEPGLSIEEARALVRRCVTRSA